MDKDNVIVPSNDVDVLDKEYNEWESTLTYNQKKRSNEKCTDEYGCNNVELYNSLKSQLVSKEDELFKEDFNIPDVDHPFANDWELMSKIRKSLDAMKVDNNIVLIIDYPKPMDLATLNALYDKYSSSITHDYMIKSDDMSLAIWGQNVQGMYDLVKSKIMSADNHIDVKDTIEESAIDQTLSIFEEEVSLADPLRREILRIDAYTEKDSFYESTLLREFVDSAKDTVADYDSDLPAITPYLTYNEFCAYMEETLDYIPTPADYIFIDNGKAYYDTIKRLQETKGTESAQLSLGWNPAIPINANTIKNARNRQLKWYNENNNIQIIDVSNMDSNLPDDMLYEDNNTSLLDTSNLLKPIYIVLSYSETAFGKVITKFKHSEYSHAGVGFDTSMDNIYSYNFKPKEHISGFTKESIKDYGNDKNYDSKIMVNTVFVPSEAWTKIKNTLKFYEDNKDKTKYSWKNIGNIVFNKAVDAKNSLEMVCSQFVDNLLKVANIDITNGKSSNLVAPGDFEKNPEGTKVFTVFKGNKSAYNRRAVDNKVRALLKRNTYSQLNVLESADILAKVYENLVENFFMYDCEQDTIHESMVKIRKMLTPTPAIVMQEFKSPVRFTDDGSLSVDLPQRLQDQYEESHKLLSLYDASNVNGMKHEVARLFYLNTIIEKKLTRMKKTDKNYKELIDLRARVLNDYSTYFKVIKQIEPDFDFMDYLKGTEYWNKTITIDGATLKYTGSYIKKALKLLS